MDDSTQHSSEMESPAEVVARLAKLSHVEFGQVKAEEAAALGCTAGELERDWKAARKGRKKQAALPADIEPWPEEVDGDALLDDLCRALRQYIVIEEKHLHTLVLWAVHTHCTPERVPESDGGRPAGWHETGHPDRPCFN